MNANLVQDDIELDYILNDLYSRIKGLNINTTHEITTTFRVQEHEDLNEHLYTCAFLKEERVIEKYSKKYSGQEEIDFYSGSYYEKEPIYCYKFKYKLRPKTLIKYMIDTSRIPKYELEFDDIQGKVILNKHYVLSKPDYDGVSYTFLSYAILRSRKIIRKEDFTKDASQETIKKISGRNVRAILDNVFLNNDLIKVFFPRISKDSAYFRNHVTTKDLKGEKINEKSILRFLKTDRTIKRIKPPK